MIYKVTIAFCSFILFFSMICVAQKQLSKEETQYFYQLIKQTKEYKISKAKVDSFNKAVGDKQVPQEISIEILKKKAQDAAQDDYIFWAGLQRRLAIENIAIENTFGRTTEFYFEEYCFEYDQKKDKLYL